ncbi:hypothetical protein LJ737_01125 [Hymenobacter sp. 15J16-1T3B]|nr:hypothetical protein [Hymenobacter sp. 15J16-1T3B]MCC3155819.1 hypothetical protein [Hymenobacter sp. 15J16-1T3B]
MSERPGPTRFARSGWLEGVGGLLELVEPVYYLVRGIGAVLVFVAQIFGD